MLIVNYTTGCRKINNFWGALNEDINKPGWWPKGIPFSSPNIRERDATPGNLHEKLNEVPSNHLLCLFMLGSEYVVNEFEVGHKIKLMPNIPSMWHACIIEMDLKHINTLLKQQNVSFLI